MKKRMTKVLALGMMAAMLISAPLSAMAAEAAPAEFSIRIHTTGGRSSDSGNTAGNGNAGSRGRSSCNGTDQRC